MRLRLAIAFVFALTLGATADADAATKHYGPPQVFTTKALVDDGYAVVLGLAKHDQGLPVSWRFKWGLSDSPYEHVTEASEGYVLNGRRPVGFESVLAPLRPDTTYHYCAIAFTAGGKAVGRDRTFHTPPIQSASESGSSSSALMRARNSAASAP